MPLKILAINWRDLKNPLAGGAEVHLEENLRRFVKMGHSVTLLTSNFPGGAKEEMIERVRMVRAGNDYTFNWCVPFMLKKELKKNSYDIVLEDINKVPFYSPLFQKLPTLVVVPHLFADAVFQEINFVLGLYIYLAEKPIPRVYRGRKFCVISESTRQDLTARGIPPEDVRVVYCGTDFSLYSKDPRVDKEKEPLVVYLGRLKKYKSVDHLLGAFAKIASDFSKARLIIIGEGDDHPRLADLTRKLGIESRVTYTGFAPKEEKVNWLQKAWVVVCPSLKEGWGLTNIEANACGTPVVCADVPGLRDSVAPGKSGLLYPYGQTDRLAAHLRDVLSNPPLRQKLEEGALEWAKNFSWDRSAEEMIKLVEEVVHKR
ncbi:MAG: glycosyltransferase family 4 protein [candidate division Zixibacteria bacterium]|nr:glycosyltransferase family 4 protein [candidate division Zixibacteria bacterium]